MDTPTPIEPERIVYSGKFYEIVKQNMKIGDRVVEFEFARRSPGTRIIIVKNGKILLSREFRSEQGGFDYRLPGGKVFDTLTDFRNAVSQNVDMLKSAEAAAKKECLEEVGIIVNSLKHFYTSHDTATSRWNLYYFITEDFAENKDGQQLEHGEIVYPEWKSFEETRAICLNGGMKEDRSIGVLLKFLESRK